ncbi:MAG: DJ-1/PfpI family protein [Clostridia bacterium]|nr:DJ-1/PfpI family protein [Clostridia bacterium]
MKKVLMMVHDGFEEVEALTTVDILRRAGVAVTVCSMTGRNVLHGSHGIDVAADAVFGRTVKEDCADAFDALAFPGGLPNAHTLRDDTRATDAAKAFYAKGKIVCAICAAPCVLEKAGLLKGRRATSYPGCIDESACEYSEEKVVRDGNMITSRGVGTALDFALAIAEALAGKQAADKVAASILYKRS